MARFCNKCGTQVRDGARFCSICGTQISVKTRAQAAAGQAAAQAFAQSQAYAPASPQAAAQPASYGASTAPQHFSSYNFDAASPGTGSGTFENSGMAARGASRPLPPLSDFFSDDEVSEDTRERAEDTVMNFSLWAAAIVFMPIPFFDLVLLLPLQTAMVMAVGKVYKVTESTERVLAVLAGACGASVFGELTATCLSSIIPFVGSLVSAPFIFGWTYGLGQVAIRYFESKGQASESELKGIFKKASKDAGGKYDPSQVANAKNSLDNLRQYMSDDDYRKIKERFGGVGLDKKP